jgi:N-acetylmuramoyl-L-alanine amidase
MFGNGRRRRYVIWLPVPRRWRLFMAGITAFALIGSLMLYEPEQASWSALPLAGRVIALDAGHGGLDGGAVSADGRVVEKDVTLAIALVLRDYLQEAGAAVVMTREDDREHVNPGVRGRKRQDLTKRVEIVHQSGAEFLISIHLNSIGSPRWRGAQTFYQPGRSEDHARLAALIQAELVRNLENTNRAAKPLDRNILLMREVQIPAALVEVGFLSNPEEAALLSDPDYQKKVAAAVYQGILRYAAGEQLGS